MGTFFITSSQPRRMILSFQSHSSLQDGEGEGEGEGGRGGRRGGRITMLTVEPQVHGSHLASLSCPEGGVVIAMR